MATPAQIEANRANAKKSTGPRTEQGKEKSSRNAFRFGLFTSSTCVAEQDREFYEIFCAELWEELAPANAVEEIHAGEFIRSAWRLRRCAVADESLGRKAEEIQQKRNSYTGLDTPAADPMLEGDTAKRQTSVDRARGAAHSALRRAQTDLTRLQTIRPAQNEPNSAPEAVAAASLEQNEPNSAPKTEAAGDFEQNEPNSAPEIVTAMNFERNEPNSGVLPSSDQTQRAKFSVAA